MNTHFSPLVNFSLQYEAVCVLCSVASDSATLWTRACQAPLSMEFSRQEYWSRWPFPAPRDFPNLRIEPHLLLSPALVGRFFTASATWEAAPSKVGNQLNLCSFRSWWKDPQTAEPQTLCTDMDLPWARGQGCIHHERQRVCPRPLPTLPLEGCPVDLPSSGSTGEWDYFVQDLQRNPWRENTLFSSS